MLIPTSSAALVSSSHLPRVVAICFSYISKAALVPVTLAVILPKPSTPALTRALIAENPSTENISVISAAVRLASASLPSTADMPSAWIVVPPSTACRDLVGASSALNTERRPVPAFIPMSPALWSSPSDATVSSRLMPRADAIGPAKLIEYVRRSMLSWDAWIPAAMVFATRVDSVAARLNCESVETTSSLALVMSDIVAPASFRTASLDAMISLVFWPADAREYIASAASRAENPVVAPSLRAWASRRPMSSSVAIATDPTFAMLCSKDAPTRIEAVAAAMKLPAATLATLLNIAFALLRKPDRLLSASSSPAFIWL